MRRILFFFKCMKYVSENEFSFTPVLIYFLLEVTPTLRSCVLDCKVFLAFFLGFIDIRNKSIYKSDFELVNELTVNVAQGLIYSGFGDISGKSEVMLVDWGVL